MPSWSRQRRLSGCCRLRDEHIYSEKNQLYAGDCEYGGNHFVLPERAWIYANHEIAGVLDSRAGWTNHPLPEDCIRRSYEVRPRAYRDIHRSFWHPWFVRACE